MFDIVKSLRGVSSLNLAFLDQEGLELKWNTVAALAEINRMDLIIHYPQMGINRLMPLVYDSDSSNDIDEFFGNQSWREIYERYRRREESFLHRHLMDHY